MPATSEAPCRVSPGLRGVTGVGCTPSRFPTGSSRIQGRNAPGTRVTAQMFPPKKHQSALGTSSRSLTLTASSRSAHSGSESSRGPAPVTLDPGPPRSHPSCHPCLHYHRCRRTLGQGARCCHKLGVKVPPSQKEGGSTSFQGSDQDASPTRRSQSPLAAKPHGQA